MTKVLTSFIAALTLAMAHSLHATLAYTAGLQKALTVFIAAHTLVNKSFLPRPPYIYKCSTKALTRIIAALTLATSLLHTYIKYAPRLIDKGKGGHFLLFFLSVSISAHLLSLSRPLSLSKVFVAVYT